MHILLVHFHTLTSIACNYFRILRKFFCPCIYCTYFSAVFAYFMFPVAFVLGLVFSLADPCKIRKSFSSCFSCFHVIFFVFMLIANVSHQFSHFRNCPKYHGKDGASSSHVHDKFLLLLSVMYVAWYCI